MKNWNQDHPERYNNFYGLYIKFQGCESGREPGEGHCQCVIGPPPQSWKVAKTMYKYLQTHIEVLKLVFVRVPINNHYFEQPIAPFIIILAKNTFTNHHGVI